MMHYIVARVYLGSMSRTLSMAAFDGDTKKILSNRYLEQINNDESGRFVLTELLRTIGSLKKETIRVRVEMAPFGFIKASCECSHIGSINELCDIFGDLSIVVLEKEGLSL